MIDLKGIVRFKISKELKTNRQYRECEVDYETYLNDLKTSLNSYSKGGQNDYQNNLSQKLYFGYSPF